MLPNAYIFKLKKIDETRIYLIEEIKNNVLVSEKYMKTCKYLNYLVFI